MSNLYIFYQRIFNHLLNNLKNMKLLQNYMIIEEKI